MALEKKLEFNVKGFLKILHTYVHTLTQTSTALKSREKNCLGIVTVFRQIYSLSLLLRFFFFVDDFKYLKSSAR